MLYFSSLLNTSNTYKPAADNLFAALELLNIKYNLIENTKDIWLRDFMPIKTRSGKFVSFRYEPGYLRKYPGLRTDYRGELADSLCLPGLQYSDIHLDGGNVVFSPSRKTAVLSDRIFSENPKREKSNLLRELERLLEAEIILIPALPARYDMTGHADGMARFLDERTALSNRVPRGGLERKIKAILNEHGIETIDFPYYDGRGISAEGCYLNYLETDFHIFLPVFASRTDDEAICAVKNVFSKTVVPVRISEIAKRGGCLNCISWETEDRISGAENTAVK